MGAIVKMLMAIGLVTKVKSIGCAEVAVKVITAANPITPSSGIARYPKPFLSPQPNQAFFCSVVD